MTSWVYIVRADNGPLKVGVTTSVRSRVMAFQQSSPNRISLVSVVAAGKFLESRIKHRWRETRMWGEWFRPAQIIESDISLLNSRGARAILTEAELIVDAYGRRCGHQFDRPWLDWVKSGIPAADERRILALPRFPVSVFDHVIRRVDDQYISAVCCLLPSNHPAVAPARGIELGPVPYGRAA